ncbi:hypothetical protein QBC38DRAFT_427079 [Podospora fimiseda]|uniref:Protein kinase domain-containing protein n=1 Tax=Podospora fimiseda TaxID=252190 RepID=A0AAN6YNK3_9PEZI|nr:hypothetical protein QBC38DRAFT_427079 [Podospora fimiseda]
MLSSAPNAKIIKDEEASIFSIDEKDLDLGRGHAERMAVWLSQRKTVLLEEHNYRLPNEEGKMELSPQVRSNIIKLGRMLQLEVCVKRLHCLRVIGLVEFRRSVHDIIIRKPHDALGALKSAKKPPLGQRYELAQKLVQSLSFLHASGWLHKNIRSEAIYFFPRDSEQLIRKSWRTSTSPAWFSWATSFRGQTKSKRTPRAKRPSSNGKTLLNEISADNQDFRDQEDEHSHRFGPSAPVGGYALGPERHRISLDIKHHPYKKLYPDRPYCHTFDVYSLGIVLLELGMWMSIDDMFRRLADESPYEEPFTIRNRIVEIAKSSLPGLCGDTYTGVTVACLDVDAGDFESEADLAEQRSLCARVAADLAQCRA